MKGLFKTRVMLFSFIMCLCWGVNALFAESPQETTRFVSLRSMEVNMRVGPGTEYPIEWIYVRQNLPVEVIGEFGIWRKIRDMEGTEGWVHQTMASKNRTIAIINEDAVMRRSDSSASKAIALLKVGVIAQLKRCRQNWCQVKVNKMKGWIQAHHVWGLHPAEKINFKS